MKVFTKHKPLNINSHTVKEDNAIPKKIKPLELNSIFATYFYHAPDSAFILTIDGTIEKCNKAALKLTGAKRPEELKGKNVAEFVHQQDLEKLIHDIDSFITTSEPKTSVYRVSPAYMPIQFIEITSSLFCADNAELRIISNVRDVTEQKRLEQKIKQNEEHFRALLKNSEDLISIIDLNGNLSFVTENIERFNGYTVKEIMDINLTKNIHPEDLPQVQEAFKTIFNNNKISKTIEYRSYDKAGNIMYIESIITNHFDDPDIAGIVLNSRNITERKITEDLLFEAKERAEQIYKVSPSAIFTTDKNHVITTWNNRAEELTGYKAQEIIGKKCATFSFGSCTEGCIMFNSEKAYPRQGIEAKIITRHGEIRHIVKNTDYLRDKEGNITGGIESFEDITEKKKAFEDMYISKKKAEDSDRLKSAFLANMSHEIRTPMNGILGFINVLKDKSLSIKEHDQYVDIIGSSGKHLLTLINDIIDISRIEAGQLQVNKKVFSVKKMMDELYDVFSMDIIEKRKKVRLHKFYQLNPKDDLIETDPDRLRQVITNLLSNAIKFTQEGSIAYGVRKLATNAGMVEFFVSDTGIGIPEEKQHEVFERFVQVDSSNSRNFGGTGLGLAISKGLITMMGGDIQVHSTLGKGTEFTFILPFKKATAINPADVKMNPINAQPYSWEGKRVLIVEDDAISFRYLEIILKSTKVIIDHSITGEKALKLFGDGKHYDLILMDIQLPGMSGYEVTDAMLKINSKANIIAQTANAMTEDITNCYAHGCKNVINKPVKREKLLQAMDKYLR